MYGAGFDFSALLACCVRYPTRPSLPPASAVACRIASLSRAVVLFGVPALRPFPAFGGFFPVDRTTLVGLDLFISEAELLETFSGFLAFGDLGFVLVIRDAPKYPA